jgi:hypothetical protein
MAQHRQRRTSPIPGNASMPIQVSRPPEHSTELNMDPVLSSRDTRKTCVASALPILPRDDMAHERHEALSLAPNMPPWQDRNANPPETSPKVLISLSQISRCLELSLTKHGRLIDHRPGPGSLRPQYAWCECIVWWRQTDSNRHKDDFWYFNITKRLNVPMITNDQKEKSSKQERQRREVQHQRPRIHILAIRYRLSFFL